MARIKLTGGFSIIPEGTYVFKITNVVYKEAFGKLEISMQTQDGQKHIERYSLLRADGTVNDGAMNAFSYFAKVAMQISDDEVEIDPQDLVGCFVECDVEHDVQPNRNDPDKTVTFVRLAEKRRSDGWDEQPTTAKKKSMDLKSLLG